MVVPLRNRPSMGLTTQPPYQNLDTADRIAPPYLGTRRKPRKLAKIFIPTMLQKLTDGVKQVELEARNVRQVIEQLDGLYPGMKDRLVEDDDIRPNLAVAIDGDVATMGLLQKVGENSEVHFIPAIGGG